MLPSLLATQSWPSCCFHAACRPLFDLSGLCSMLVHLVGQALSSFESQYLYIYMYTSTCKQVKVHMSMYVYPVVKHEHGEQVIVGACRDLCPCMATGAGPQVHILSDSNCTCAKPANTNNTRNKMASLSSPIMFFRTWVGTFMSLVHVGVASRNPWELQLAK